jgi:hypothetical protein
MDVNFAHAYGTVMILAWVVFGSAGVLFARYGRVLRFGNQRQLLGKSIWFQAHRFLLSLSSLLTLLGFFFIIIYRGGQWVNPSTDNKQLFAHTVLGSIVVCCVIVQIWLALYRCHPNSRFRFIFNWSHRIIGSLTSSLSFINLFLMVFMLTNQSIVLIIIVSLWTIWVVIVVTLFEIIQYQYRKASALMAINARISNINQEPIDRHAVPDTEVGTNPTVDNRRLNKVKLILFLIHVIISVVFCIPILVIIWNDS